MEKRWVFFWICFVSALPWGCLKRHTTVFDHYKDFTELLTADSGVQIQPLNASWPQLRSFHDGSEKHVRCACYRRLIGQLDAAALFTHDERFGHGTVLSARQGTACLSLLSSVACSPLLARQPGQEGWPPWWLSRRSAAFGAGSLSSSHRWVLSAPHRSLCQAYGASDNLMRGSKKAKSPTGTPWMQTALQSLTFLHRWALLPSLGLTSRMSPFYA